MSMDYSNVKYDYASKMIGDRLGIPDKDELEINVALDCIYNNNIIISYHVLTADSKISTHTILFPTDDAIQRKLDNSKEIGDDLSILDILINDAKFI